MDRKRSEIEKLLEDPATSFWLKAALRAALTRDPIDAERDASTLYLVLRCRAEQALKSDLATARPRRGR
ncbi:hypothetical protein DFR49_0797 [Hephaestia caeni]|uniref:Uncharacterized protein n=1 Tax=Hephaestia caeni TaxID=645617 RepID=A0A397PAZ5_9SPHN|nr:hypothetical protein DFR49_0797 [Hephaestia caeni]